MVCYGVNGLQELMKWHGISLVDAASLFLDVSELCLFSDPAPANISMSR